MVPLEASATVLVVDDDVDIREALSDVILSEGGTAVAVPDGRRALEYLRAVESLPRLIILDLMMPGMSGWEFRQHQAADERLRDVPVVVVSAASDPPPELPVLRKPLSFGAVLGLVRRYCS